MLMWIWNYAFMPFGAVLGFRILIGLLGIAGIIFSLVMLIDCLKRTNSEFYYPIIRNGEYDRLIWAIAIVLSLWFFFIGAIAYYFVVKTAGSKQK